MVDYWFATEDTRCVGCNNFILVGDPFVGGESPYHYSCLLKGKTCHSCGVSFTEDDLAYVDPNRVPYHDDCAHDACADGYCYY